MFGCCLYFHWLHCNEADAYFKHRVLLSVQSCSSLQTFGTWLQQCYLLQEPFHHSRGCCVGPWFLRCLCLGLGYMSTECTLYLRFVISGIDANSRSISQAVRCAALRLHLQSLGRTILASRLRELTPHSWSVAFPHNIKGNFRSLLNRQSQCSSKFHCNGTIMNSNFVVVGLVYFIFVPAGRCPSSLDKRCHLFINKGFTNDYFPFGLFYVLTLFLVFVALLC